MSNYKSADQRNKDGYNQIHDMLTAAKTIAQLTKAVEAAIPMIQEFKLDSYQQQRLEDYGMKRFNDIQRRIDQMAFECSRNKFKK